jgi:hypothetical protein
MNVLTDEAARTWLERRGMRVIDAKLSFSDAKKPTVFLLSPSATREAVTALAVNLVGILSPDDPVAWLLWLTDFDIWSNEMEEVGWTLLDSFLESAHQPKLNPNASALLFGPDETLSLKATLIVPILFMWDAYLVSGDGDTFVRIDHDDHNSISTISNRVLSEIKGSQLELVTTPRHRRAT